MKKSRRRASFVRGDNSEAIAVLAALAGRGRYASPPSAEGDSDPATVVLYGPEGPVLSCARHILDGLVRRGWICPASAGRLCLSAAGKEALRRQRSRLASSRADAPPQGDAPPAKPTVNRAESPLAWLSSRRDSSGRPLLPASHVAAGERLRADLTFACLLPRITMSWSGTPFSGNRSAAAAGFGSDVADNVLAARARVTGALKAVGPEFADILIDVCGHLRGLEEISQSEGWPRHAARLLLQRGLAALARHYGLEPEARVEETIARRLLHWGAEDYRPKLSPTKADQAD